MTPHKKPFRVYVPMIGGAIILLATVGVIIHMISNMEEKPAKKERKIQVISLTKPPPPPPPPPKVEKPPEPEVEKLQEKVEQEPEETPDVAEEPPAAGDLGLDAEGSAGSDGFGLAAHKGGKGLLGGGGGDPYAWYSKIVNKDLTDFLSENEELRRKGYIAIVKMWVEADGSVNRFELAKGSNDAEIDDLLNRSLSKFKRVNEPLPPGLEQPIRLKVTSRI